MRFDWREELYQLLIGHFGDAPFDDGIREIAAIAAYHSETHEQILAAIQGACDAALTGDESAYLSQVQQEIARKA
jgi:hypothetical protein